MRKILHKSALLALVAGLWAAPAAAAVLGDTGLELGGFVQTSWQGNYTSMQNDFRIDEVQLSLGRQWKDKASFHLRLNYRHVDAYDFTGATLPFDYNKLVEQAFVTVDLLKPHGFTFTFGKFRIPAGIESPNVNESFTYSRSYTLEVGLPQFGTGAMARFQKGIFDIALYAINGWNTLTDNNDAKTFGGRVGVSLLKDKLTIGVSYVGGPEPIPSRTYINNRSPRHVIDVDAMFTGIKNLTIGAEFNYSYEDRASQVNPDKRARWLSVLGLANYRILPWLSATVRFEHADDPDGARLSLITPQVIGSMNPQQYFGMPLTIESVTASLLFTLAPGAHAILEWRNDYLARDEDRGIFPTEKSGPLTKTRRYVAASLYYTW